MSDVAISVRGLRKSYGDHEVVRGIDLEIAAGEVFGFLGPNGLGALVVAARRFRWEPQAARG